MNRFNEIVSAMICQLREAALQADQAKLKAIGKRNLLRQELEGRQQKKVDFEELLKRKKAELARCEVEYLSLKKIEAEQQAFIERILEG